MSNRNRPCVNIHSISKLMKNNGGIAVVVGTVTGDTRNKYEIPKGLKVCALRFTETSRAALTRAGGQIMTFDQLALVATKGSKGLLLRGRKKNREAVKHFGLPP